jgi:AraC family transcriptional activator of pobA
LSLQHVADYLSDFVMREQDGIMDKSSLKENTRLIDEYFPINLFGNFAKSREILHLHWHDYIEIIYMIKGHAVFYIGNESVSADPGDILFVNSGQFHSGYSIDDADAYYYALVFDKAFLSSQYPDPVHVRYIAPFLDGRALFPAKISCSNLNHKFYKETMESVIREFKQKGAAYEIAVKSYLYILTIAVCRDFVKKESGKQDNAAYKQNIAGIKSLLSYIDNHYNENIALETAANIMNLSQYHFCKIFKKITGRTFVKFLNLYRISKAEELLRKTDLPVSVIAEETGFCNINYFDRIFKQYRKYPPTQYRQKASQETMPDSLTRQRF